MTKTVTERQQDFRARHGHKFKRLDVLLPVNVFDTLHANAKEQHLAKSDYIAELLKADGALDELAAVKQLMTDKQMRKQNYTLKAQVLELERVAALDASIMDDLRAKILHGN